MYTVTVSRASERLVAVKTAPADSADPLRSEARILEMLGHPGLIELIDIVQSDDRVALRTAFAGADTWASRPLTDPVERAAGIASVAATIADLHSRGVTHGALQAEHVIRGDDGRPVLCGLTRTRADSDTARGADVAALADLIDQPPVDVGPVASALDALAARIRSGACEADDVVHAANRIVADAGRRSGGRRPLPSRRLVGVATILALFMTGAIVAIATARRGDRRVAAPAESDAAGNPVEDVRSRATPASPTAVEAPAPAEPGTGAGPVIDHRGRQYMIGRRGDVVVLGDWDCDGDRTAAVLRPSTGEIAVFDGWPAVGDPISLAAGWNVDSARDLTAEPADGCDRLRVETDSGSRLLAVAAS